MEPPRAGEAAAREAATRRYPSPGCPRAVTPLTAAGRWLTGRCCSKVEVLTRSRMTYGPEQKILGYPSKTVKSRGPERDLRTLERLTLPAGSVCSLLPGAELSAGFNSARGAACPEPLPQPRLVPAGSGGASPAGWVQRGAPTAGCGLWCRGRLATRGASALTVGMRFQERTSPSPPDAGTSPSARPPSGNVGKCHVGALALSLASC